jgi:hypothetical protein
MTTFNAHKKPIKEINLGDLREFNLNENSKIKIFENLKKYIEENLNDYILIEKSQYNEKPKEKKNSEIKLKTNEDNQNKKLKEIENEIQKLNDALNEVKKDKKKNEKFESGDRELLNNEEIAKLNKEIDKYKKILKDKNSKFTKLEKINITNFNLISHIKNKEINKSKSSLGCVGIKNESNSCYMISVIQCIKNYIKFTHELLKCKENKDNKIILELKEILIQLFARNRGSISIMNFKRLFINECNLFDLYEENDSTIFLMCLLEKLHEKLNKKKSQNSKYDLKMIENFKNDEKKNLNILKIIMNQIMIL